jgi:limonene-1,2-epoxide hydrolase
MTKATPGEVVEAFITAFEAMDFDAALSFIAPDCEYTNVPMGTATGPEGVRSVLEPFFAPIDENDFVIHRKAVEGKVVFYERLDRHRLGEAWRELPVVGVFEVEEGLITVWREYFDLATAAKIHAQAPQA